MTPLDTRILDILRTAIGRDNLISSKAIALRVGLRGWHGSRTVRARIEEMLADGTLEDHEIALCAIPGLGYFLPTSFDHAQAYINLLAALAAKATRKLDAAISAFRRVGLHVTKPDQSEK